MSRDESWLKIFNDYKILDHNFEDKPFELSAEQIKNSVKNFAKTSQKEVRILCKIDSREDLPKIMMENHLFLLPVKNKHYIILKGEGYVDIPEIKGNSEIYNSKIDFQLETSKIGNSEMQHLDFAYASSLIRTFMGDDSLVLTIRGRKYAPNFSFKIQNYDIGVQSVQTEVDAGYEGRDKIVLIEAKNSKTKNTIIRQLFYPYRQWSGYTKKQVFLLFFEKRKDEYLVWQYSFEDKNNYNSIKLIKSKKYKII